MTVTLSVNQHLQGNAAPRERGCVGLLLHCSDVCAEFSLVPRLFPDHDGCNIRA